MVILETLLLLWKPISQISLLTSPSFEIESCKCSLEVALVRTDQTRVQIRRVGQDMLWRIRTSNPSVEDTGSQKSKQNAPGITKE